MNIFVECVESNKDDAQRHIVNLCDRIWLRDKFPDQEGRHKKYELQSDDGTKLEGSILEKGFDQRGHYILFLLDQASYYEHKKIERPRVTCGMIKVKTILSPEMIIGAEAIVESRNGKWPCFHEAMLTVIEQSQEHMILHFQGGFLESPIKLEINGITRENYGSNHLAYFTNDLTSVEFRKKNDHMEVQLCNDFITSTLPKGIDISEIDDESFQKIEFIEEEFVNHGVIMCRSVEMKLEIE